jgi:hypothetical protein
MRNRYSAFASIATSLVLAACGGGDTSPSTFMLGGTVTGLSGSGLVLQQSSSNSVTVSAAGPFQFPQQVANGTAYSITVQAQPTNPSQTCVVSSGSGTVSGGAVSNIAVTCSTNTYALGGTVSGMVGSGLVLSNGSEILAVSANGSFTFGSAVTSGTSYSVAIQSQPSLPGALETCATTSNTGIVASAAVASIVVTCDAEAIPSPGTTLALATGASVSLYKVSLAWATTGSAPTPFQVLQTPNITGLVADPVGNIYYTANNGTSGSAANFFACPVPASGQPYACSIPPNTTTLPGGKLLAFDPGSAQLLAADIQSTGSTIVAFPVSPGPTTQNQTTIYTSSATPVDVNAQVIDSAAGNSLYVTEIPASSMFGSGTKAFACLEPCAAGTQLDITQTLMAAAGGNAQLSGIVDTLNNFNSITFGLANSYGAAAAPATLPIALQCGPALMPPVGNFPYVFSCGGPQIYSRSYPQSGANASAFVGTAGFAVDSNSQLYAAATLTTQGQTITASVLTGYGFWTGYQPNCSVTPAACPVNLLQPTPVATDGGLPSYLMTMSANCQLVDTTYTTYCGTFKATVTNQQDSSATNVLLGTFRFTTQPPVSRTVTPGGPGTGAPIGCVITLLNPPAGQTTKNCDGASYYTDAGAVTISAVDQQITLTGTISANSVSGTATVGGEGILGTGTGTFAGTVVTQ